MQGYTIEAAIRRLHILQHPSEGKEAIHVGIRLVFLRLGELDTQAENFQAHIVIEARWFIKSQDEKDQLISTLSAKEQAQLSDGENIKLPADYPETHWHPQLFLLNVGRDFDEDIKYIVKHRGSEIQIREFRDIYGKFYSKFDLHHFPSDIQELSVSIGSALFDTEVILEADLYRVSGINREAFVDQQEWSLYDHVETRTKFIKGFLFQNDDDDELDTPGHERKRSILTISCHAARRSTYFYWNGYCLIFLITMTAFSSFAIPPNAIQNRINIACTLLLTSIAFRWTISNSLPNISYLTIIDRYAIVSIFVLIILCAWHSIIGTIAYIRNHYAELDPESYWTWLDRKVFFALIGLYILVHFAMGIWHWRVPIARRHHMATLDRNYRETVKSICSRQLSAKSSINQTINIDGHFV